jgi:hypothetical protein
MGGRKMTPRIAYPPPEYLGNGVFANYDGDGALWIKTRNANGKESNQIVMRLDTLDLLNKYAALVWPRDVRTEMERRAGAPKNHEEGEG